MSDSREPQLDELRRRARRRLVGAVVLALAAAVLVPMLLESDPKPLGEDVAVKIPPIDDGRFVSKVGEKGKAVETAPATKSEAKAPPKVELAPPPSAATTAVEAPKGPPPASAGAPSEPSAEQSKALASAEQRVLAPPQKPAASTPAKPAAAPMPPKEAAPPPTPAAKPEPAAKVADADKAGGYAVQLAAFVDDKGANALAGKLKKAGYSAYTEPYETTRGTLWRVRVGPYPSRDAAEGVRTKLKDEGHNGIIATAK